MNITETVYNNKIIAVSDNETIIQFCKRPKNYELNLSINKLESTAAINFKKPNTV